MSKLEWQVDVAGASVSAVYEPARSELDRALFVCAHGAGGSMNDRSTLAAANELRGKGFGVVRFNFLYKERGSGRPDQMPKLMTTFAAVVERARAEVIPRVLLIGGRSMGGRTGSMLAAEGFGTDGLLLLAYPLHPPGGPEKLRDEHLPRITVPVLCCNGTRDAFCTPSIMNRVVKQLSNWEMHWLDGADHSFHVLKSSGRNDAAVLEEMGETAVDWRMRHWPA